MHCTDYGTGRKDAPPPETLRQILKDAQYLREVGAWPEAKQRAIQAAREWALENQRRPIGHGLALDWLADDVSAVTGLQRDVCRREARRIVFETRLDAVARELRLCVLEINGTKSGQRREGCRCEY